MVQFLCALAFSFSEGDWLVLTPFHATAKPILALLREDPKPYGAEEIAKKLQYEFHKLSDGTTLFYPSTANERERRRLQIQLISQLKGKVGSWTSTKDLPPELANYVNAQLHSKSADHSVSLIASINVTIGNKKSRVLETVPPKSNPSQEKEPQFYDDKLAEPYALCNCSFDFGSKQGRSVIDQSRTLELTAKYIQELFKEIDHDLRDAIEKSFENNDSYSKKMRDLIALSGRKIKNLPLDLQQFLWGECFGRDSGTKLSDLANDDFSVDSKGYALEAQASYGGKGVVILPIKTGA